MTRLRIGIVGCGEVAQIIHIPALQQLAEQFEITALCDVDATVLAGVAGRLSGTVECSTDYRDIVTSGGVDAVLVANPNIFHAEVALAAMNAGKDVLIEKPMCVTRAEADALDACSRTNGRIAQIGYMRRYAGALGEAGRLVAELRGQIRLARLHDVIGRNALIIDDTSNVLRAPDPDGSRARAGKQAERARIAEAIGTGEDPLAASYSLLLGLSSHDLSAMRELLGPPLSVLHATHRAEGRYITATFDYGDFVCLFSTGVDDIPRFDTYLEVYAANHVVRVDYDTPYVRHLPARLSVTRAHGSAGVEQSSSFPSREDTFMTEWLVFHDHVTRRAPPKMGIGDARVDLELALEIIERIRAG